MATPATTATPAAAASTTAVAVPECTDGNVTALRKVLDKAVHVAVNDDNDKWQELSDKVGGGDGDGGSGAMRANPVASALDAVLVAISSSSSSTNDSKEGGDSTDSATLSSYIVQQVLDAITPSETSPSTVMMLCTQWAAASMLAAHTLLANKATYPRSLPQHTQGPLKRVSWDLADVLLRWIDREGPQLANVCAEVLIGTVVAGRYTKPHATLIPMHVHQLCCTGSAHDCNT